MSSILDALRKIEGQSTSEPGPGEKKSDLFRPPPPRRGPGARNIAIGVAVVAAVVLALTFLVARRERAKEGKAPPPAPVAAAKTGTPPGAASKIPADPQARLRLAKARRDAMIAHYKAMRERALAARQGNAPAMGTMQTAPAPAPSTPLPQISITPAPAVTGVPPATAPQVNVPVAGEVHALSPAAPSPSAPSTPVPPAAVPPATAQAPTPQVPLTAASPLAVAPQTAPGSPAQPTAPLAPSPAAAAAPAAPAAIAATAAPGPAATAPTTPSAVAPAPAVPQTVVSSLAPTAGPAAATPARIASPRQAPRRAKPAAVPAPTRVETGKTPLLMVTEVTYHDSPARRSAMLQVAGGKPLLVREGDTVNGIKVNEIQAGAVELEVAGGPVVLDVGQSMSLTVSAPDFH